MSPGQELGARCSAVFNLNFLGGNDEKIPTSSLANKMESPLPFDGFSVLNSSQEANSSDVKVAQGKQSLLQKLLTSDGLSDMEKKSFPSPTASSLVTSPVEPLSHTSKLEFSNPGTESAELQSPQDDSVVSMPSVGVVDAGRPVQDLERGIVDHESAGGQFTGTAVESAVTAGDEDSQIGFPQEPGQTAGGANEIAAVSLMRWPKVSCSGFYCLKIHQAP